MAQLIVRDLSEDLVKMLKQRAAKRNHSTEQEHREILQSVLRGPRGDAWRMFLRRFPTSARTAISYENKPTNEVDMYLIDTDVISEIRKGDNKPGRPGFFRRRESPINRSLSVGSPRDRRATAGRGAHPTSRR